MNTKVFGRLTNAHIIIIIAMLILIFQGVNISINNLNNQVATQFRETQNKTTNAVYANANDTRNLIKAIDVSDEVDDNRTKSLLTETVAQQVNLTNSTNTLLKYLTDNFGAQSGYLERENFQYAADNVSRLIINATIDRVTKLLDNVTESLQNQDEGKQRQLQIIANQEQILSLLNKTK